MLLFRVSAARPAARRRLPRPRQPAAAAERGGCGAVDASSSPPPLVLHYFPGRGAAEPVRWLLAASNSAFVDSPVRCAGDLEALRSRPGFPPGPLAGASLPVLEERPPGGGCAPRYTPHAACALRRAAALRPGGGWAGRGPAERRAVDHLLACAAAWRAPLLRLPLRRQEAAAAVRRHAPGLEAALRASPSGWAAGGARPTAADVVLAEAVVACAELFDDFFPARRGEALPRLEALQAHAFRTVAELPALAAWLASPARYPPPLGPARDAYLEAAMRCGHALL